MITPLSPKPLADAREGQGLHELPAPVAPLGPHVAAVARAQRHPLDRIGLDVGEDPLLTRLGVEAALLALDLVEPDEGAERRGDEQQDPGRSRIHLNEWGGGATTT